MSGDNFFPPDNAVIYLVNAHRRLFLRKAFGINPDGTPIPNIEEFNNASIKTYRAVKTIVCILKYWGNDKFLASTDYNDPDVFQNQEVSQGK